MTYTFMDKTNSLIFSQKKKDKDLLLNSDVQQYGKGKYNYYDNPLNSSQNSKLINSQTIINNASVLQKPGFRLPSLQRREFDRESKFNSEFTSKFQNDQLLLQKTDQKVFNYLIPDQKEQGQQKTDQQDDNE